MDFSLFQWNCSWILDCNCRWDSGFLELYYNIYIYIPDSKAQDLGFKSKFSQILDPPRKTFLDSGMRIPLHQAASSLFPAFRSCGVWPEIRERETIPKKEELRERESSHPLPHPLAVFPAHTLWFRLKSERQ